jgi:hypothetical protein
MTEEEWLSCDDPTRMLTFLKDEKFAARTSILILASCCRRQAHLLTDRRSLRGLDVLERLLYNEASKGSRNYARHQATLAANSLQDAEQPNTIAANLVCWLLHAAGWQTRPDAAELDSHTLDLARAAAHASGAAANDPEWRAVWKRERTAQAVLFRDVLGNPFRPAPPKRIMPGFRDKLRSWREANNGLVARLAQAIHEERRYTDLPIVGDALEDAGCTNADILAHCRQATEHTRGCWALELCIRGGS